MNVLRAWFYTQIASWALAFKRRDVAFDYFGKILSQQPDDAVTMARVAFLHAETGETRRAIREFERVVAIKPSDADSWFNLAFLRQALQEHDVAIDAFEAAIRLNERHDRALYGKALSLIALGRREEAIPMLLKNVELQPMSPYGHMELARQHFALGDSDKCEKRMRKLKSFDPKNAALLEDETGISVGIERWWKN